MLCPTGWEEKISVSKHHSRKGYIVRCFWSIETAYIICVIPFWNSEWAIHTNRGFINKEIVTDESFRWVTWIGLILFQVNSEAVMFELVLECVNRFIRWHFGNLWSVAWVSLTCLSNLSFGLYNQQWVKECMSQYKSFAKVIWIKCHQADFKIAKIPLLQKWRYQVLTAFDAPGT